MTMSSYTCTLNNCNLVLILLTLSYFVLSTSAKSSHIRTTQEEKSPNCGDLPYPEVLKPVAYTPIYNSSADKSAAMDVGCDISNLLCGHLCDMLHASEQMQRRFSQMQQENKYAADQWTDLRQQLSTLDKNGVSVNSTQCQQLAQQVSNYKQDMDNSNRNMNNLQHQLQNLNHQIHHNICEEIITAIEEIINAVNQAFEAVEKWVESEFCVIIQTAISVAAWVVDQALLLIPDLDVLLIEMKANPFCLDQEFAPINLPGKESITYADALAMAVKGICEISKVPELKSIKNNLDGVCHATQMGTNIAKGLLQLACGGFIEGLWTIFKIPVMCSIKNPFDGSNCGQDLNYDCTNFF
eukprot:Awhi_evm1s14959